MRKTPFGGRKGKGEEQKRSGTRGGPREEKRGKKPRRGFYYPIRKKGEGGKKRGVGSRGETRSKRVGGRENPGPTKKASTQKGVPKKEETQKQNKKIWKIWRGPVEGFFQEGKIRG
ncbi:hypothetical protein CHS0354_038189, partial [Potamilus streckersoni]